MHVRRQLPLSSQPVAGGDRCGDGAGELSRRRGGSARDARPVAAGVGGGGGGRHSLRRTRPVRARLRHPPGGAAVDEPGDGRDAHDLGVGERPKQSQGGATGRINRNVVARFQTDINIIIMVIVFIKN